VSFRAYAHGGLDAAEILDELRAQAVLAIGHGFDGVMTSEHHGGFPGYLPNPLQLAGFLLHDSSAGWVAPCPLLLPLRPASFVAEEVAWLSARFPGRVGVGVAAGALPLDFELAGVTMDALAARFGEGLDVLTRALRGAIDGPLADDAAIARCARHPVPVLSAAASVTAARRAASYGAGLLFDSLVTPGRVRTLVDAYRNAGGVGACVLVRRVWLGAPPSAEVAQQVDVYRGYAPSAAPSHWGADEMIAADRPADIAARLVETARAAGADALNVRVHVPGVAPEAARAQIAALGTEVVPLVRAELCAS
jgi:alkanesulfonate monooxygenase SsuD/methylene tetrahydromethanopterin reductase-like flavin-dependent oxidoreductase (luciferase family)